MHRIFLCPLLSQNWTPRADGRLGPGDGHLIDVPTFQNTVKHRLAHRIGSTDCLDREIARRNWWIVAIIVISDGE
jgi:hypothetical protein